MLTSVRGSWVNWSERLGVLDELERAFGCSAEGALCGWDRDRERCQCVEDGQRVEREWNGVKCELMNCDQRETRGGTPDPVESLKFHTSMGQPLVSP